jgi:hypothetical protein
MLVDVNQKPEISKSKYELTLAEFPLFILSKKDGKGIQSIVYEDTIQGKDNKTVKRTWKVYPDAKCGFGTESTFGTLFDLFQLWKEANFETQYIQFGSVYNLLKQRGISLDGKDKYARVMRDLTCLVGMRIEAINAFWDNERQAYVDMTFHLFDSLALYKDKTSGQATLPFATIKASDVLYGSIQRNSLLTADFDSKFFHSLTPVEQRIALYLSKVFRSQSVHKRGLLEFAEQIPIHAKQTKHLRETIKKASQGLITKGYKLLDTFSFEKGVDGNTDMVIFRRKGTPYTKMLKAKAEAGAGKEEAEIGYLAEEILEVCQDEQSSHFYRKVAIRMDKQTIFRALAEVKEEVHTGTQAVKNKGALFTSIIKKYALEQGIEL